MWRSRDATCCDVNVACVSLEHVWSANIKDFECVCVAMQYRPPTESYDAAYYVLLLFRRLHSVFPLNCHAFVIPFLFSELHSFKK